MINNIFLYNIYLLVKCSITLITDAPPSGGSRYVFANEQQRLETDSLQSFHCGLCGFRGRVVVSVYSRVSRIREHTSRY